MTKILLVEDDKSLREIYGVRLLAEGYDIVSAGDGEEALAMAIKDRPDLIVSDVMMPKISGFDMLDILRSTTETRDIKVIMMTALSSEDQRQRGVALGADRYLVKSQVGIEDVVRTVHDVLGDAPTLTGASAPSPYLAQPAAPQPVASAATAPPQPAAPAPEPIATTSLPQPTAPFSTQRPVSLGDRVIHPIESNKPATDNIASLMDQELAKIGASTISTPNEPEEPSTPLPPMPAPTPAPDLATPPAFTPPAPVTTPLPTEPIAPTSPIAPVPPAPQPMPLPPVPPLPQMPATPQYAPQPVQPTPPAPATPPMPTSPISFEETPLQVPDRPTPPAA